VPCCHREFFPQIVPLPHCPSLMLRLDFGENSLKQHRRGYCLGISPLRARDFLMAQDFRGAPVEMTDAKGSVRG
jgi:hypothetical protein